MPNFKWLRKLLQTSPELKAQRLQTLRDAMYSSGDTIKGNSSFAPFVDEVTNQLGKSGVRGLATKPQPLPELPPKFLPSIAGATIAGSVLGYDPSQAEAAPWHSKLVQALETKMPKAMDVDSFVNFLKKQGITDAEMKTLGNLPSKPSREAMLAQARKGQLSLEDYVLGGGLSGPQLDEYKRLTDLPVNQITPEIQSRISELYRLGGETGNTQFSSYQLPGGKNYREMFVTAPDSNAAQLISMSDRDLGAYLRKTDRDLFNHIRYEIMDTDFRALGDQGIYGRHRRSPLGEVGATYRDAIEGGSGIVDIRPRTQGNATWQDGHSPYSNIQNPVVRLRFNEREVPTDLAANNEQQLQQANKLADALEAKYGMSWKTVAPEEEYSQYLNSLPKPVDMEALKKRILFLEEMQGPSESNQGMMDKDLQKRLYDIGVKRALTYAKENGFQGVAWTPGQVQADRYDLSKQVDRLHYKPEGDGFYITAVTGGEDHKIGFVPKNKLVETVGKDAANKMNQGVGLDSQGYGALSGLDLQVGGEGLKNLYDQMLPKMFEKYGKEKVGKLPIDITEAEWGNTLKRKMSDVPYIPITSNTPSSFSPWKVAGGGIGLAELYQMLNGDNAEASPLGKLKALGEGISHEPKSIRNEDAFYKLLGHKLNLAFGNSVDRKPYEVVDVRKNPQNDWRYVIVKDENGKRHQLPMTKDYLNVLLGAKGTQDYVEKFANEGLQGKKQQAFKSLGIREEKRSNTADVGNKLFREWNAGQAAKAQEIDPSLLNDYSYVKNEQGQTLYMPKSYADFLASKGYVTILKR